MLAWALSNTRHFKVSLTSFVPLLSCCRTGTHVVYDVAVHIQLCMRLCSGKMQTSAHVPTQYNSNIMTVAT